MRVERLEKAVLFPAPAITTAALTVTRLTKLGADGKRTTGDHVAVFDSKTGLTWSAEPVQGGKEFTHADALKACASLDLLGKQDWRAPTIQELLSIVDYTRCDPAVDTDYFKAPYSWTWSSTIAKAPAGDAWLVYLNFGSSDGSRRTDRTRARARRTG